ncbi:hypothetical protein PR048_007727 [Dryococelus australis]|uniref:Uncharacterized protein n=1 Tax=Dryococelus australis TaxID=614101 RepID=A0ABQ9HV22_9NEOP|nr:hypothetical protein PR048_007727 [Dryococelus australis]
MEQRRNARGGGGGRGIPEKTHRPAASSGTIPTCENLLVTRPGIEPGTPWWEASWLTARPPRPLVPHAWGDRGGAVTPARSHRCQSFPGYTGGGGGKATRQRARLPGEGEDGGGHPLPPPKTGPRITGARGGCKLQRGPSFHVRERSLPRDISHLHSATCRRRGISNVSAIASHTSACVKAHVTNPKGDLICTVQRYDGNTARLARRSDETLGVRVSVARIAPSLLKPWTRSEGSIRAAAESNGWGKRDIPEKTLRPAASSGTITTCGNPGVEPGSPGREATFTSREDDAEIQRKLMNENIWQTCSESLVSVTALAYLVEKFGPLLTSRS